MLNQAQLEEGGGKGNTDPITKLPYDRTRYVIHRNTSHSLEITLHPLNNRIYVNITNTAVSFTNVKIILQFTKCLTLCAK